MVYCPVCGYDLGSKGDVTICPACGNEIKDKIQDFHARLNEQTTSPTVRPPNNQRNTFVPQNSPPNRVRPTPQVPDMASFANAPQPPQNFPNMPQGVQMGNMGGNFHYARFGERVSAFLLDFIFSGLIGYLLFSFIGVYFISSNDWNTYENFMQTYAGSGSGSGSGSSMPTTIPSNVMNALYAILFTFIIFLIVIDVLYYVIIIIAAKGKTLGKAIMKMTTVDADTNLPLTDFGRVLIDSLSKILIIIFPVILIDLIIGAIKNPAEKQQIRITQKLARSAVIRQTPIIFGPMGPTGVGFNRMF